MSTATPERRVQTTRYESLFKKLDLGEVRTGKSLVVFRASWCGPCKLYQSELDFSPALRDWAASHQDVKLYRVNVDDYEEFAAEHKVTSIPATLALLDGKVQEQFTGCKTVTSDLIPLLKRAYPEPETP